MRSVTLRALKQDEKSLRHKALVLRSKTYWSNIVKQIRQCIANEEVLTTRPNINASVVPTLPPLVNVSPHALNKELVIGELTLDNMAGGFTQTISAFLAQLHTPSMASIEYDETRPKGVNARLVLRMSDTTLKSTFASLQELEHYFWVYVYPIAPVALMLPPMELVCTHGIMQLLPLVGGIAAAVVGSAWILPPAIDHVRQIASQYFLTKAKPSDLLNYFVPSARDFAAKYNLNLVDFALVVVDYLFGLILNNDYLLATVSLRLSEMFNVGTSGIVLLFTLFAKWVISRFHGSAKPATQGAVTHAPEYVILEAEDEPSLFAKFSSCFSNVVTQALGTAASPRGESALISGCKSLNVIAQTHKNVVSFLEAFLGWMPDGLRRIIVAFLPAHQWKLMISDLDPDGFFEECRIRLTPANINAGYNNDAIAAAIETLANKAVLIRNRIGDMHVPPSWAMEFRKYAELAVKFLHTRPEMINRPRLTPFCVYFTGKTGTGKTVSCNKLASAIGCTSYTRMANLKHWDGYHGEPVVILDDFAASTEADYFTEFMTMISNATMPLPMATTNDASIGMKGTRFTSRYVFASSNDPYPKPNTMVCHEAIHRRRHLLVDTKKVVTTLPDGSEEFETFYSILDPISSAVPPSQWLSFEQFLAIFIAKSTAHFINELNIVAKQKQLGVMAPDTYNSILTLGKHVSSFSTTFGDVLADIRNAKKYPSIEGVEQMLSAYCVALGNGTPTTLERPHRLKVVPVVETFEPEEMPQNIKLFEGAARVRPPTPDVPPPPPQPVTPPSSGSPPSSPPTPPESDPPASAPSPPPKPEVKSTPKVEFTDSSESDEEPFVEQKPKKGKKKVDKPNFAFPHPWPGHTETLSLPPLEFTFYEANDLGALYLPVLEQMSVKNAIARIPEADITFPLEYNGGRFTATEYRAHTTSLLELPRRALQACDPTKRQVLHYNIAIYEQCNLKQRHYLSVEMYRPLVSHAPPPALPVFPLAGGRVSAGAHLFGISFDVSTDASLDVGPPASSKYEWFTTKCNEHPYVVGFFGIVAGIVAIYWYFKPSIVPHTYNQGESARKEKTRRIVVKSVTGQGSESITPAAILDHYVEVELVAVVHKAGSEGIHRSVAGGLCSSNILLMPSHYVSILRTGVVNSMTLSVTRRFSGKDTKPVTYSRVIKHDDIQIISTGEETSNYDLVACTLPEHCRFKSLVGYAYADMNTALKGGNQATLLLPNIDECSVTSTPVTIVGTAPLESFDDDTVAESAACYVYTANTGSFSKGDCGAPLVNMQTTRNGVDHMYRIMGFHVFGYGSQNATRGGAVPITAPMIVAAEEALNIVREPVDPIPLVYNGQRVLVHSAHQDLDFPLNGQFNSIACVTPPATISPVSELQPTSLYDLWPRSTDLSVLRNNDPRLDAEHFGKDILAQCCMKAAKPDGGVGYDPDTLKRAVDLCRELFRPHRTCHKLSYDVAIYGGEGHKSLNMSTSAGLPWKYIGTKRQLLFDANGNPSVDPQLNEYVKAMEVAAQRKQRTANLWFVALKDERRKLSKIPIGATRTFYCCSLPYAILWRRYFLDALDAILEMFPENPSLVGLDVQSPQFHAVAMKLKAHPNFYCSDISNNDGDFPACLIQGVHDILSSYYTSVPGTPDDNVRLTLAQDAKFSYNQMGAHVYLDCGSVPSGFPGTTITNTIGNTIDKVYHMLTAAPTAGVSFDLNYLRAHFCIYYYGDDNVTSYSDEAAKWWSPALEAQLMKEHGRTCTNDHKTGPPEVVHSIEECSILKHTFALSREFTGMYVGLFDINVARDIAQFWRPKSGETLFNAEMTNIHAAQRFLWFHGPDVFNEYTNVLPEQHQKEALTYNQLSLYYLIKFFGLASEAPVNSSVYRVLMPYINACAPSSYYEDPEAEQIIHPKPIDRPEYYVHALLCDRNTRFEQLCKDGYLGNIFIGVGRRPLHLARFDLYCQVHGNTWIVLRNTQPTPHMLSTKQSLITEPALLPHPEVMSTQESDIGDQPWNYITMLQRKTVHAGIDWKVVDTIGTELLSVPMPLGMAITDTIMNVFKAFEMSRFTACFRIEINGTKFHSGSVAAYFEHEYQHNIKMPFWWLAGDHAIIDANGVSAVELRYPFTHVKRAIMHHDETYSRLKLLVNVPLGTTTGNATTLKITLTTWFEDVSLYIPRVPGLSSRALLLKPVTHGNSSSSYKFVNIGGNSSGLEQEGDKFDQTVKVQPEVNAAVGVDGQASASQVPLGPAASHGTPVHSTPVKPSNTASMPSLPGNRPTSAPSGGAPSVKPAPLVNSTGPPKPAATTGEPTGAMDLVASYMDGPYVTPCNFPARGNCDNIEPAQIFRMHPSAQTLSDPSDFGTSVDEMLFAHLLAIPAYIGSFNITVSQNVGDMLWSAPVNPLMLHTDMKSTTNAYPTSWMTALSAFATYWTGSIDFTFVFASNLFQTGKVIFAVAYAGDTITTINDANAAYNLTYDLSNQSKRVTIRVPYMSDYASSWCARGLGEVPYGSIGNVHCLVLTPLNAPNGSVTTIPVQVFVSAGPTFQLSGINSEYNYGVPTPPGFRKVVVPNPRPVPAIQPLREVTKHSMELNTTAITGHKWKDEAICLGPKENLFELSSVSGEKLTSLRDILKRRTLVHRFENTTANAKLDTISCSEALFKLPATYLLKNFLFMRGSLRFTLFVEPLIQTVSSYPYQVFRPVNGLLVNYNLMAEGEDYIRALIDSSVGSNLSSWTTGATPGFSFTLTQGTPCLTVEVPFRSVNRTEFVDGNPWGMIYLNLPAYTAVTVYASFGDDMRVGKLISNPTMNVRPFYNGTTPVYPTWWA
jgi:hypothetical protein